MDLLGFYYFWEKGFITVLVYVSVSPCIKFTNAQVHTHGRARGHTHGHTVVRYLKPQGPQPNYFSGMAGPGHGNWVLVGIASTTPGTHIPHAAVSDLGAPSASGFPPCRSTAHKTASERVPVSEQRSPGSPGEPSLAMSTGGGRPRFLSTTVSPPGVSVELVT